VLAPLEFSVAKFLMGNMEISYKFHRFILSFSVNLAKKKSPQHISKDKPVVWGGVLTKLK
jgi:hypothetical protein